MNENNEESLYEQRLLVARSILATFQLSVVRTARGTDKMPLDVEELARDIMTVNCTPYASVIMAVYYKYQDCMVKWGYEV